MQIQESTVTEFDRYPRIFRRVADYVGSLKRKPRVLSFGCSSGEEVRSLDQLYVKGAVLVGVDVDPDCLDRARKIPRTGRNQISIHHYEDADWRTGNYDVALALSVLCKWPTSADLEDISSIYSFSDFSDQVSELASLLRPGGVLVVHNSSFFFEDTLVYKEQFRPMHIDFDYLGEVKRFDVAGIAYTNQRSGNNFFVKVGIRKT